MKLLLKRLFAGFVFVLSLALLVGQRTASGADTNAGTAPTLVAHLSTNAAARTVGHSPENDLCELANWQYGIYTNGNLALITNAVWSTNFWLHGVQGLSATCIGFSNGMGGQGLVTMISPRHYLFAAHMHPEGYLIPFLDTNNVIHWRKTLQRIDVPSPVTSKYPLDTSVGILNEDLPSSVGFLPVVPTNLSRYIPEDNSVIIQGIGMNQDMRVFGQPMGFGTPPMVVWDSHAVSPLGVAQSWNVAVRSGDSSNPERLLIGNQLVLVSHNLGIQAGPNYAYLFGVINKTMHELSKNNHVHSDYQLTPYSLSKWPQISSSGK